MGKIVSARILPGTAEVGLFISGSAAKRNILYTCAQLEALEKPEKQLFSVYDDHGEKDSRDIEQGCGVPLAFFLEQAGIADAEEVKLRSTDGFESIVTEMRSKRYYFPGLREGDSAGRELREAFVSFYKNGKKVKFYPHPTIMFGQQGLEDKNKDSFAKGTKSLVSGGRDRAFWVKGSGIACNRYFSLDQLFELEDEREYRARQLRLTCADGTERTAYAVRIPEDFWEREITRTDAEASLAAVGADGSRVSLTGREKLWLFFADEEQKTLGFYDGEHILDAFAGFQIGELTKPQGQKTVRVPEPKDGPGDFYIRILEQKKETARYDYTLEELRRDFADAAGEEEYVYYNHNMNSGQGGNRMVTARGWYLAKLLELLPEIPDREFLESGGLVFQIFTRDTYKEKIALEGNELTAFRFMLACEQDQRTETGLEKGDTSAWEDPEKNFEPIRGNTPYRIYCKKSSANPAVYKNAEGVTIELL